MSWICFFVIWFLNFSLKQTIKVDLLSHIVYKIGILRKENICLILFFCTTFDSTL